MSDPHISKLVARKMGRWHGLEFSGVEKPKESKQWSVLEKWMKDVPEESIEKLMGLKDGELEQCNREWINNEIAELKKALLDPERGFLDLIGLTHNDLLNGNIVYDEQTDSVMFIDFEYANWAHPAFDIANHFCEFCGFEDNYDLYPEKEFQMTFITEYLRGYKGDDEYSPDQEELELWYRMVNAYALLSHFWWGAWGLIQGYHSEIKTDFDYVEYSAQRYREYLATKEKMLNM
eukprot:TRINITY_DN3648_c0_g2_i1.p1 TRINITY_DN3648_c0_g2~~TRINITY_DN3648_c0_g2_i1.p1  ORF type:complete len:234 (+),score=84.59 TRINITY_DN3648_c0_g2_i1:73-774(+)